MPTIVPIIDKCFFSKRDTSILVEKDIKSAEAEKKQLLADLAPKHKVTVIEFSADKSANFEDILQNLYFEVEMLIGYSVEKSLARFSDEMKVFVLAELLKDCLLVFHNIKMIDQELMVELQRLSLTLKRHTRARLRLLFNCAEDEFDYFIDAGLRMEYMKFYFTGIAEEEIKEIQHAVDVEIKLERRGVERFLGSYIESVKLRPRVKSFLGQK